jgi:putative FmdB family regulatory protein
MPIYEYRCTSCGEISEAIQKVGDPPLRRCPSCPGRLEKMVSRTAFLLKGGGWYSEGYDKGGGTKGDSKPDSKSESSGDTKTSTESPSKSSAAKRKD